MYNYPDSLVPNKGINPNIPALSGVSGGNKIYSDYSISDISSDLDGVLESNQTKLGLQKNGKSGEYDRFEGWRNSHQKYSLWNDGHRFGDVLSGRDMQDSLLSSLGAATEQTHSSLELLYLPEIVCEKQFRKLVHENETGNDHNVNSTIHKFYGRGGHPVQPEQGRNSWNHYYSEYLEWKQQVEPTPTVTSNQNEERQKDISLQRQLRNAQFENLKDQYRSAVESRRYSNMCKQISTITEEYKTKIDELVRQKDRKPAQHTRAGLGIQKIEYPIIMHQCSVNHSNPANHSNQASRSEGQQMHQISYCNIIKRPPKAVDRIDSHGKSESLNDNHSRLTEKKVCAHRRLKNTEAQQFDRGGREQKLSWKLDVNEILKIPEREFLVFFNRYERKLTALCTPDQLKRLTHKRDQVLQKEQTIGTLRDRISQCDPKLLQQLGEQQKHKLFQLLYQDELEEQREKMMNNGQ